jgi:hypothetical protein
VEHWTEYRAQVLFNYHGKFGLWFPQASVNLPLSIEEVQAEQRVYATYMLQDKSWAGVVEIKAASQL